MQIVKADCAVGGEATLQAKLLSDLSGMADERTIRAKIVDFMTVARHEALLENAD